MSDKKVRPPSGEFRSDDFLTIIRILWTGGGWKAGLVFVLLILSERIGDAMNAWKKHLQEVFNISDDFAEATDHPRSCRCDKCRVWWTIMWNDDEADASPFTKEELFSDSK